MTELGMYWVPSWALKVIRTIHPSQQLQDSHLKYPGYWGIEGFRTGTQAYSCVTADLTWCWDPWHWLSFFTSSPKERTSPQRYAWLTGYITLVGKQVCKSLVTEHLNRVSFEFPTLMCKNQREEHLLSSWSLQLERNWSPGKTTKNWHIHGDQPSLVEPLPWISMRSSLAGRWGPPLRASWHIKMAFCISADMSSVSEGATSSLWN